MKAVSNYLGRIQERHFASLQRKTHKLDPVSSSQLSIYLSEQLGGGGGGGGDGNANVQASGPAPADAGMTQQGRRGRIWKRRGRSSTDRNEEPGVSGDVVVDAKENGVDLDNNDRDDEDDVDDDDSHVEPDYELVQRDLDRAYEALEQLETKRDFIKTRLDHYKIKIKTVEEQYRNQQIQQKTQVQQTEKENKSTGDEIDDGGGEEQVAAAGAQEDSNKAAAAAAAASTTGTKIQQYKEALKPVEVVYEKIESDLRHLQRQIKSMHERQQELKLKTEECEVVLKELCGLNISNPTNGAGNSDRIDPADGSAAATAVDDMQEEYDEEIALGNDNMIRDDENDIAEDKCESTDSSHQQVSEVELTTTMKSPSSVDDEVV
jgi:hypothetical protein